MRRDDDLGKVLRDGGSSFGGGAGEWSGDVRHSGLPRAARDKRRTSAGACVTRRSSVGGGEIGGEFRDHPLERGLIAGLVDREEGGQALLERIGFGGLLRLLQLGDLGLDGGDLPGLFISREL